MQTISDAKLRISDIKWKSEKENSDETNFALSAIILASPERKRQDDFTLLREYKIKGM